MSNNKSLQRAKEIGNDEFYTLYQDIDRELSGYGFTNKLVYCNCDDYRSSQFFKYFVNNFHSLNLKGVVATGYCDGGQGYYAHYDGSRLYEDRLTGDGDYNSQECLAIRDACDIVVTNPPFSLIKDYLLSLLNSGKEFIIIAPEDAITYKNVFPYVMYNKVWTGNNLVKNFLLPDGSIQKFGNICWLTNVISKQEKQALTGGIMYSNEYPFYENYDAINIDKVSNIPVDYYGVMGVPVSYFKYYNPMEFDIVGISSSSKDNAGAYFTGTTTRPVVDGKYKFTRLFIKRKNLKQVI